MRLHGIDHLVLTVADLQRSVDFYARLGAREVPVDKGRRALMLGAQRVNLHPAGAEVSPHAADPRPGSADVCLLVEGPLEAVLEHLAREGIGVEVGPVPRVGAVGPMTSVYVRDPDGNLVELSEPSG